jgi:hypothetical protein
MLAPPHLDGGAANFLARREFAVLTGRATDGRLWTSPLLGQPGFLDAAGSTLEVHAAPSGADPLAALPAGQAVGLIAIEFAIRRRFRVNGLLSAVSAQGLTIEADQAFGNCPSYIQQRVFEHVSRESANTESGSAEFEGRAGLDEDARALIRSADTFFLGTAHPERGVDTSHKGGRPGFVRVDEEGLWWPDYAGNNMFNSLGNLTVNPEAALLFADFGTGRTLQLSGTATLEWIDPGSAGDDGETGRRVRFHPEAVRAGSGLPVRSAVANQSPDNPALRG